MKDYQARGILLQEELETLLSRTGTLRFRPGVVRGQGADHSGNGWGELAFPLFFQSPLRIYCHYKCYSGRLELSHMRGFYGMLVDVDAFSEERNPATRYTNTGAYFSATGFTRPAQEYAWARGIWLFPLEQTHMLLPALALIRGYVRDRAEDLLLASRESLLASFRIYQKQMVFHNQNDFSPSATIAMLDGSYPVLLCGTGSWLEELAAALLPGEEEAVAQDVQVYGDECESRFRFTIAGCSLEFCLPGVALEKLERRGDRQTASGFSLTIPHRAPAGGWHFMTFRLPVLAWEQTHLSLAKEKGGPKGT